MVRVTINPTWDIFEDLSMHILHIKNKRRKEVRVSLSESELVGVLTRSSEW